MEEEEVADDEVVVAYEVNAVGAVDDVATDAVADVVADGAAYAAA